MNFRINKLLLLVLGLSAGLFLVDRISAPLDAYTDANATQFPGDIEVTDLKLSGNDITDSGETVRISVGSTNAITGNVTISGTLVTTGAQTQTSTMTFSTGFLVPIPSAQTIASGGTIASDACGGIKKITNNDAVTTDTTNTFTAPSAANTGCVMFVLNVGTSTITLDNNALFVSKSAGNVAVTGNDALTVASDGSKWYQLTDLEAN